MQIKTQAKILVVDKKKVVADKKKQQVKKKLVGVNTHFANKIAYHGLSNNLIKEVVNNDHIKPEVFFNKETRFDFLIEKDKPSFKDIFPDAMGLFFVLSTFLSNFLSEISFIMQPAERIKTDPKRVNRKNLKAEYTFLGPPQTPIIRNIGINPASKNRQKTTKSRAQKTPIMKLSIINIAIKKSLNLVLTELFTEIIHKGVMNVVNKMNKIEINNTLIDSLK